MSTFLIIVMLTAAVSMIVRAFKAETVMEFIRRLIFAIFGSSILLFVTSICLMAVK